MNILSFGFLLLFTTFSFGQKWSSWEAFSCYKGLKNSAINFGKSEDAGGYLWGVRFQNDYDYPVQFEYKVIVGGERYAKGYGQITRTLKPGEIWTEGNSKVTALLFQNNSDEIEFEISKVCFKIDGYDCYKDGYAQCDDGNPFIPNNNISSHKDEQVFETVDEPAKFPNGINALKTQISDYIDFDKVAGSGNIRTELIFVINQDGSISNIEVNGVNSSLNNEAKKALNSVKTLWIPAKVKGKPVKYRLRLPISISL